MPLIVCPVYPRDEKPAATRTMGNSVCTPTPLEVTDGEMSGVLRGPLSDTQLGLVPLTNYLLAGTPSTELIAVSALNN